MKLSIVTTLYYSAPYIKEFYQRIKASIDELQIQDYEIIFVDDGSPDNSLEIAKKLISKDQKVSVIELSRNFGHHKAMMTGLRYAQGDYVFLIDVDLEEEPELLVDFWKKIHKPENNDVDVVYGVQKQRKGKWFERESGKLFYTVFNFMSDNVKIKKNCTTVRIMKKNFVSSFIKYTEKEFYFAPITYYVGYNQIPLEITKRSVSPTTYNFSKKYNMLINSVFSFSKKPLFFIFYSGCLLTIASFIFTLNIIIRKLFFDIVATGWTSLIVSVWFLGGVIILFLGIIAIYLSKVFEETKNRPFSIVKKIWREI